jgi:hypothetical protein
VGKYLLLARPKPAISTPGSESNPNSKPAISTAGSATGRQSLCQPHSPQIEAAVEVGLSAQRIYQDLVYDNAFTGSYQAVKRFVRHLRETQPIPFVRMEVEPGAEAQMDFGQGAWVVVDGKRKRPHLFRVVLSHSRKGYSEVVWRQTTEFRPTTIEDTRGTVSEHFRTPIRHEIERVHLVDKLVLQPLSSAAMGCAR